METLLISLLNSRFPCVITQLVSARRCCNLTFVSTLFPANVVVFNIFFLICCSSIRIFTAVMSGFSAPSEAVLRAWIFACGHSKEVAVKSPGIVSSLFLELNSDFPPVLHHTNKATEYLGCRQSVKQSVRWKSAWLEL